MARSDDRALVGFFDVLARMIDQVHVVHAGRTGGHAGKARQAAVDMLDHFACRRPVLFEHLLDQVDAPARRIELVAEQHIGRAGRGAESAMHAGAQDFLRGCDLRVEQLREGERGLHIDLVSRMRCSTSSHTPAHMRPGLSTPLGSKLSFTRLAKARKAASSGANTSTAARTAPARVSAWHGRQPRHRAADRGGVRLVHEGHRHPNKTAGPVIEHLRRRRDCGGDLVSAAGRNRDAPKRPRPRCLRGERLDVRMLRQSAREFFSSSSATGPKFFISAASACLAVRD